MDGVVVRLGIDVKQEKPALLHRNHTPKEPLRQAFPRPAVIPVPQKSYDSLTNVSSGHPTIMKKRGYEQANGLDGKFSSSVCCFLNMDSLSEWAVIEAKFYDLHLMADSLLFPSYDFLTWIVIDKY